MRSFRNFLISMALLLAASTLAASAADVSLHLVNRTGGTIDLYVQGIDVSYNKTAVIHANGSLTLTVPEKLRIGFTIYRTGTMNAICRSEALHWLPSGGWKAEAIWTTPNSCGLRQI